MYLERVTVTLFSLLACFVPSAISTKYYVQAPGGASCPLNTTCYDLSFYARQADIYFTSDSFFYFLEGKHSLDQPVIINGINTIKMQGIAEIQQTADENIKQSTAEIHCSNQTNGISFINSSDISMCNLTFINCGIQLSQLSYLNNHNYTALLFGNVTDITLYQISVINSTQHGIVAINGFGITLSSSSLYNSEILITYTCTSNRCLNAEFRYHVNISDIDIESSDINFDMMQGRSVMVEATLNSIRGYKSSIGFNVYTSTTMYDLYINNFNTSATTQTAINVHINDKLKMDCVCSNLTVSKQECPITITNSHFENTIGETAGGILLYLSEPVNNCRQSVVIDFCSITNSNGRYAGIGILQLLSSASVTITNTVIDQSTSPNVPYTASLAIYSTTVTMENITLSNGRIPGILTFNAMLIFKGPDNFLTNNTGRKGAGIGLHENSHLQLSGPNSRVTFTHNRALDFGGGIFLGRSETLFSLSDCFLELISPNSSSGLYFINNSAKIVGDDIYGLSSETCNDISRNVFNPPLDNLSVSSDPVGVCVCDSNNILNCNETYIPFTVRPGEQIELSFATVATISDGLFTFTSGSIRTLLNNSEIDLYDGTANCTRWVFTARSESLEPENLTVTHSESSTQQVTVALTFDECLYGFELRDGTCTCSKLIDSLTCNNNNGELYRTGNIWIGLINTSETNQCIATQSCPHDYCRKGNVEFTIEMPDPQCALNRSGVLCGECDEGLSLMLGSNRCGECDNSYIALVIPFALAGIVLVAFLIAINLTVSVGTINGLIFYANIVKLCEDIFFPDGKVPVLSQFLYWINLDFGIETCFYKGLDNFAKIWLQFVFPFYIWIIILFIIFLCEKSVRMSHLIGQNVVPVLATLLLLSYTKLFRIIGDSLAIIELTVIDCDSESVDLVWYVDPNVDFLKSKQGFLFAFALFLLVVLCVPYTTMLLLGPQVRGYISRYCCSRWWIKLKPFFDAYNSPYGDHYRFWTGLLLLVRVLILIMVLAAPQYILPILISVIAGLLTLSTWFRGVYKQGYLNLLESWFLFNTIVVAASTATLGNKTQNITIISLTLVFVTFIAIVIYHIYLQFKKTSSYMVLYNYLFQKFQKHRKVGRHTSVNSELETSLIMNEGSVMRRETLLLDEDQNDRENDGRSGIFQLFSAEN